MQEIKETKSDNNESNDVRDAWNVGDQINVLKSKDNEWFNGKISKIETDTDGIEWLLVTFKDNNNEIFMRKLQRYSKDIQSISNIDSSIDDSIEFSEPVIWNKDGNFKTIKKELWFNTRNRMEFIDITSDVTGLLNKSGVMDGFILISPMHITASVLVQNNDKVLFDDFRNYLENKVIQDESMELGLYNHNSWGDSNGDSHIKRQIFKREVWVCVTNGKIDVNDNESIIYAEFDGRRRKRVLVKILGY